MKSALGYNIALQRCCRQILESATQMITGGADGRAGGKGSSAGAWVFLLAGLHPTCGFVVVTLGECHQVNRPLNSDVFVIPVSPVLMPSVLSRTVVLGGFLLIFIFILYDVSVVHFWLRKLMNFLFNSAQLQL